MPSSENDRQFGIQPPRQPRYLDGRVNHASRKQRNAQANSVADFARQDVFEIGFDGSINDRYTEPRIEQRRCQAQQAQRRPEGRPFVRWMKEDDLVFHEQFTPFTSMAGSSCFASTFGLATET